MNIEILDNFSDTEILDYLSPVSVVEYAEGNLDMISQDDAGWSSIESHLNGDEFSDKERSFIFV